MPNSLQPKIIANIRSYLKNRILVQDQGGIVFQSAGILSYFEELKHDPNTDIGPKDIFKMASSSFLVQ